MNNKIVYEIKNYLMGTREFRMLKRASDELKKTPEAYSLVAELHKKHKTLNSTDITDEYAQRIMYELEMDYKSLSKHHVIAAYFEAEEKFSELIARLINEFNSAIAIELEK